MKTILTVLSFFIGVSVSSAASVVWSGGGFGAVTSGTAYLIHATATSPVDISDIADHIETKGLNYTGTDFVKVGQTTLTSATSIASTTLTYDVNGNVSNYFTIIIHDNESKFIISNYKDITSVGGSKDDYTAKYSAMGADKATWSTGTVYSVPEPTALALLALGVAGLALRRKRV